MGLPQDRYDYGFNEAEENSGGVVVVFIIMLLITIAVIALIAFNFLN